MKCLSKNFHFEFEHDIEKKILPPFYKRNEFLIFFQNLFSTLYNIYFSHQDRLSRFREN